MKVLFLSAWYPHKYDAMDGLFVRKHASSVALYNDVAVLFIKADPKIKKAVVEKTKSGEVEEYYIYYPAGKTKISKAFRFLRYYVKGIKIVKKEWGRPEIVHANVLTRHVFVAYMLKLIYGTPYVITEHWTRYIKGEFTGFFHRKLTAFLVKRACAVMPVSEELACSMRSSGLLNKNYRVVRNVVDDFFFLCNPTLKPKQGDVKVMVHICAFDEKNKNNFGLLRALKRLKHKRSDFKCVFVGYGRDWFLTKGYAESLGLNDFAEFVGEKSPQDVCNLLYNSAFSVLFSRYETASVVMTESLSVGTPIVVSDIKAIAEIVDSESGYLVPVADEDALFLALDKMLDNYYDFDGPKMQKKAKNIFSAERVGSTFTEIYKKCVNR